MFDPELAQALVEQHYRSPRHKGCCENSSSQGDTTNPMCGDEVSITLRVVEGGVECARFEGQGCAVSQAGASLAMEWLQGKSVEDAKAGLNTFVEAMVGGEPVECGELSALYAVRENPARATCAMLAAKEVLLLLG